MTETMILSDEAIPKGLNANPKIRSRIASLLAVVQDAAGDLKEAEADAVERRLIEEIRLMGQEAMQCWANRQVEVTEQDAGLAAQSCKPAVGHVLGNRFQTRSVINALTPV